MFGMPPKPSDKWRVAYHEAGHVVANLIYELPFQTVSMAKKTEVAYQFEGGKKVPRLMAFTVGIDFPRERLESLNNELMAGILDIKEAVTLMAGPIAEHRLMGGKVDDEWYLGRSSDVQGITACCRAAVSGSGDPGKWEPLPEMEEHMVLAISYGAYLLVKENWASVKAIAEKLHSTKELDYAGALKIAEANGLAKLG